MNEHTVYAIEKNGDIGGIGIIGAPTTNEIKNAAACHIFRRGDVRIYVLVVTGRVTFEECRLLAVKYFEGDSRKINFSEEPARFGIRSIQRWERSS